MISEEEPVHIKLQVSLLERICGTMAVRQMRRAYQQVDDPITLERWLNEAVVGRLATIDENGYPVIKPVNFVFSEGKIIFHSARAGEKQLQQWG